MTVQDLVCRYGGVNDVTSIWVDRPSESSETSRGMSVESTYYPSEDATQESVHSASRFPTERTRSYAQLLPNRPCCSRSCLKARSPASSSCGERLSCCSRLTWAI